MVLLLAAFAQQISTEQIQKELGGSLNEAIVKDAIRRWAQTFGSEPHAMTERVAIVFEMDDQDCVLLKLRARAVGGSPVYCYESGSSKLVRAFDQVE